jgi:hypothetical protein
VDLRSALVSAPQPPLSIRGLSSSSISQTTQDILKQGIQFVRRLTWCRNMETGIEDPTHERTRVEE